MVLYVQWRAEGAQVRQVFGFLFGTFIGLAVGKYGQITFLFLVSSLGLHVAQIFVSTSVILAGIAAHLFKKRNQMMYGLVEVAFAAAFAFSISAGLSPEKVFLSQWAALVGCAYVVARGLNNFTDGQKQDQSPDRAAAIPFRTPAGSVASR